MVENSQWDIMHYLNILSFALFLVSIHHNHAHPVPQDALLDKASPCFTMVQSVLDTILASPDPTKAVIDKVHSCIAARNTSALERSRPAIKRIQQHVISLSDVGNIELDGNEYDFTCNDCLRCLTPFLAPRAIVLSEPPVQPGATEKGSEEGPKEEFRRHSHPSKDECFPPCGPEESDCPEPLPPVPGDPCWDYYRDLHPEPIRDRPQTF
jgi:hypothetical protein